MMNVIRFLIVAAAGAAAAVVPGPAHADGPDYGSAGPYQGQPQYQPFQQQDPNQPQQNAYQAPPSGECYDDNNQPYDCGTGEQMQEEGQPVQGQGQGQGQPMYGQPMQGQPMQGQPMYGQPMQGQPDMSGDVDNQLDDGYDQTAYQDFQDTLSPYGSWVDTPEYGQIWTPSSAVVGFDFSPYYSGGRWALTDYGWTWASDYNWGWAPFHYGRWISHGSYGWCWVPGRIWGPAWVNWRAGGGYVGWTPLPPRGVRIAPPLGGRANRWNFVGTGQLGSAHMTRANPAMVPQLYSHTLAANTFRGVGNTQVNLGPSGRALPLQGFHQTPLHSLTQALPRAQVNVRPGMPVQTRPYAVATTLRQAQTLRAGNYSQFQGRGATYATPSFQHAAPARQGFSSPGYQRPYQTSYRPTQVPYSRPAYSHPTYARPTYSAPVYSRPSAPSYSAPSHSSGGGGGHFSGGGGHVSGGGGGHGGGHR